MSVSQHFEPVVYKKPSVEPYNPPEKLTKKLSPLKAIYAKRNALTESIKIGQSLNNWNPSKLGPNPSDQSKLFQYVTKGKYYKKPDIYDQSVKDNSHFVTDKNFSYFQVRQYKSVPKPPQNSAQNEELISSLRILPKEELVKYLALNKATKNILSRIQYNE